MFNGSATTPYGGKVIVVAVAVALVFATVASAAGPIVPWAGKDMKAAIRAVGYPKPHAKTVACKGQGETSSGLFASFRCSATYKHHHRAVFYVQGEGEGGWLCAGKTLAGCKLLKHGFVTSNSVKVQGLVQSVDIAARGYMGNKYGTYQPQGFCSQTTPSTWSCPFVGVTLTVTLKQAKGGYLISSRHTERGKARPPHAGMDGPKKSSVEEDAEDQVRAAPSLAKGTHLFDVDLRGREQFRLTPSEPHTACFLVTPAVKEKLLIRQLDEAVRRRSVLCRRPLAHHEGLLVEVAGGAAVRAGGDS